MRKDMFECATKRSNNEYIAWPNPNEEHPTSCYPNFPLFRYPSKYEVKSMKSAELCDKDFTYHNKFSAGIYSKGCACEKTSHLGFK